MRIAVVGGVLASVLGSARADPGPARRYDDETIANTRIVVASHADRAHHRRMVRGTTGIVLGAGLAALGTYAVVSASEGGGGGLVDMRPLTIMLGSGLIGIGGVKIVKSTLRLTSRSGEERLRDDLEATVSAGDAEGGVRHARAVVAERATANHHSRAVRYGLGTAVTAVGVGLAIAGVASQGDWHDPLLAAGATGTLLGGGLLLTSMSESSSERLHRDLAVAQPTFNAGIVPVRGGAVAGISGTL